MIDGFLTVTGESAGRNRNAVRLTRRAACTLAAAAMLIASFLGASHAQAPPPTPQPTPQVSNTSANTAVSSAFAALDLNGRYLQYLGGLGGPGWLANLFGSGPNPGGGGAPAAAAAATPRYRAWAEVYGLSSRTGPQVNFPGDTRSSVGGVAGLAANVAPGLMLGMSVDQSRTRINIVSLPQHATLDLTQVGVNAAYETGAWTFSAAGVAGFAHVDSNRDTPSGPATAGYRANLYGAIGEASYYIPLGAARIVPKFGADWTRVRADAYTEAGGIDAVVVPAAVAERARVFAGGEIGRTWVIDKTVLDLSWYGRGVDIIHQQVPSLTINAAAGPATPITVIGVSESKYGFDTGAAASVRLSPLARLYALYDGRFRHGFQSHGGTLGLELRW